MSFPFPTHIDSSMRSSFAACPRKFFYQYVMRRIPSGTSVHLTFGGAMARGLEVARLAYYQDGASFADALQLGRIALLRDWCLSDTPFEIEGSPKSIGSCLEALEAYFRQFSPHDDYLRPMRYSDGRCAVEFTFAIPLPPADGFPLHPQTGLPILYTGRFDMLAETRSGALYIEDDKTTSQLGLNFTRSMKLRSQFTGYKWACDQLGIPARGIIVRATQIGRSGFTFAEITETRPPHLVEQWYWQLKEDVEDMVRMWERTQFNPNLDDSCGSYGGCPYLDACLSPHPDTVVSKFMVPNLWDPLAKEHSV